MRLALEKQIFGGGLKGVEIPGSGVVYEQGLRRAISTGIEALDRLLPQGGIPCGHLTQMVGSRGSGRTTFMISTIAQVARRGERSAVVDLEGDLDPLSIVGSGIAPELVWVVSAQRSDEGLWAADLLLRSGHFRLVVLDGLEGGVRTSSMVRLQRQARESDAALLVGSGRWPVSAPGSLQLQFRPLGVEWSAGLGTSAGPRRVRFGVEVGKGRGEARVGFECRPRRLLGRHSQVPDRRAAGWTEPAPLSSREMGWG